MNDAAKAWLMILITMAIAALIVAVGIGMAAGQSSWWDRPAIRACCSEADALFADEWRINPDGSIHARVTGGGPRNHAWAPIGREYTVPREKVRDREGNPTGRPLIFINPSNHDFVFCFVPGALI